MIVKKTVKIAVRELVAHTLRTGDLDFEFLGAGRNLEAIRIHQRIQKSRPPTYAAEVPVSFQAETGRFILSVNGRIDGVFITTGRVVIEEIKTTTRPIEEMSEAENPLHWGQLKAYAYMYAAEKGLDRIETRLTYAHLETGETREFDAAFSLASLETFFDDLVDRYMEWARKVADWREIRDTSIRELQFPFAAYRPGQREMAVGVYRTIREGEQLLAQAATGIGKTMAVVFPGIKALAEGMTGKVFYLTARTTARTVAEGALDELRRGRLKIKSLTLTAKDKICFRPGSGCVAAECEYARGHYDRINDALSAAFNRDALTREVVEAVATTCRVCPFELSLELSLWSDLVICDYNYAFDPRVFLRRFFLENDNDYTFLIDEAHNLVDRGREMFSAEIEKQPFLDVRRGLRKDLPHLYTLMGKINSWMLKARKAGEEGGAFRTETDRPEDLLPLLRRFLRSSEKWLATNIKTPFRDELLDLYFGVGGFLRVAELYDDTYATCYEKAGNAFRVKLFCIDPSVQMREALKRCRAAILFSATLTPAPYFREILGCRESAGILILPSPFPPGNSGIFILDRISTLYRARRETAESIARALSLVADGKKGNYLFFFPSYEYMVMVSDRFKTASPRIETIVQSPGMSEPDREAFLSRFSLYPSGTLVGFAVMGGIFGEGIDLAGDRLSGAAVVGVGLPGLSPERELIREYFARQNGKGFEFAYQYPGINRVFQAAGRVIRSETDRGVVVLIDERFSSFRYRSLFPPAWNPKPLATPAALQKELEGFWGNSEPSPNGAVPP